MAGISVDGLSSGIDSDAIIEALTASQKRRIATMEGRVGRAAGRQAALAELSAALGAVREALAGVSDPGLFGPGGPDTAAIGDRMEELVEAYNAAQGVVARLGAFNAATGQGAPLFADAALLDARRGLDSVFSRRAGTLPAGNLRDFAGLGVKVGADGTATLDASKLDAALTAIPAQVSAFLAAPDGPNAASSALGLLTQDTGGSFATRSQALGDTITALRGDIQDAKDSLEKTVERLAKRFAALEEVLAQVRSTSNFISATLQSVLAARQGGNR